MVPSGSPALPRSELSKVKWFTEGVSISINYLFLLVIFREYLRSVL